ncbi:MAG: peptidase S16, partial [Gammaproteobacteria bacterium]|nr:peptidase S16 [Gammaproteobacteria bacterium]
LARITDWYQGTDGLLGITATGTSRFRLQAVDQQADGLNLGEIERLPTDEKVPVPEEFAGWSALLEAVLDDLGKLYEGIERDYQDANWLGYRFAEILPLEMEARQACLEMNDPIERLKFLQPLLRQVREGQIQ